MCTDSLPSSADSDLLATVRQGFQEEQQRTLAKLETIIQKGEAAFFATAKAVAEIIDDRLFHPAYPDKTSYFRCRWDMTPQNVSRFENAARVLNGLTNSGVRREHLPKNEGQCRELYRQASTSKGLDYPLMVEIWTVARQKEKVSAKVIAEVANEIAQSESNVEVSSDEVPVVLFMDTSEKDRQDKPMQSACDAQQGRIVRLVLRTSSDHLDFKIDEASSEYIGERQYQWCIERSSIRGMLQQLIEWDGIEDVESLQLAL